MKVSLNWIKQFTDIDIPVDELVKKIGAQLGEVDSVVDLGKRYQGIVVVKVVTCEKHPNADKLNICMIDDGGVTQDIDRNDAGLVQVVCGAPNVREGLSVAWLPPGLTVPSSYDGDPFVLGARELRGVMSNGMLASASELAIGTDHDGIVELDLVAEPGSSFAQVYGLNDHIIEIENKMFTHRPDCFGILGVAREIAGILHKPFVSPDWYLEPLDRIKPGKEKLDLVVRNNASDLVPRFMAVPMSGVTVHPSPFVLQTYLSRVGIRPINNVVDSTNYIMVLTGQPTHAYDADKLKKYGPLSLETRMSRAGDEIALLNGKNVTLQDESTVLITSNDVPVGLAGVMGGADTEVDADTKNIVVECASFDMYSIRRTSMKYGLFTDAVTRFNKGQSKLQNERIIEETVTLVKSLSHAEVAGPVQDLHQNISDMPTITVSAGFVNDRLGLEVPAEDMAILLKNVECDVSVSHDELTVQPPFWRTDLEIPEDIVEEIGRLYGYDRVPLTLPMRNLKPVSPDKDLTLKQEIRESLAAAGANEVLTYGFVHGDVMRKTGQKTDLAYSLTNALSPDLQYYRLSLTPSLLDKVHSNVKSGFGEFALFELGKVHSKSELDEADLPKEFGRLGFVIARGDNLAAQSKSAYYQAKYYVEYVLQMSPVALTYKNLDSVDTSEQAMFAQMLAPFEPKRSAVVYSEDVLLGVVGEYKRSVTKACKLPAYCAGFELFLSQISAGNKDGSYLVSSRYPAVTQDITLRAPVEVTHQSLEQLIYARLKGLVGMKASVSPVSIYMKDSAEASRQTTFRIVISSYEKTLTTDEVSAVLDDISREASASFGAERI